MKTSELRLLSVAELNSKIAEVRRESMNLRFQMVTGQLTDTSRLKQVRRLIAKFETIKRELELKSQSEGEA
jgi:large subunit ribosomal protein L29